MVELKFSVVALKGNFYYCLYLLWSAFVVEGTNRKFASVQEFIGFIYSIGSIGSLLGVLLYQIALKDYPFRSILLWGQVLSSLAGMLDLALVTRLNLKMGIPDYFFAVIDNSISQMVGRLQWLPLLVLCSKLCPPVSKAHFTHCSCLYKMPGCLCLLGGVACCCRC